METNKGATRQEAIPKKEGSLIFSPPPGGGFFCAQNLENR